MIPERLEQAFRAVGAAAHGAGDDWWIIGSSALVLAGIDGVEPDDVDLLGSRAAIRVFLERWGMDSGEPVAHPLFRSHPYRRVELPGCVPIETMGGLEVFRDAAWKPVVPLSRVAVEVAGTRLYIPSPAEQCAIFRLFGRPKDLDKARRVEALVGGAA